MRPSHCFNSESTKFTIGSYSWLQIMYFHKKKRATKLHLQKQTENNKISTHLTDNKATNFEWIGACATAWTCSYAILHTKRRALNRLNYNRNLWHVCDMYAFQILISAPQMAIYRSHTAVRRRMNATNKTYTHVLPEMRVSVRNHIEKKIILYNLHFVHCSLCGLWKNNKSKCFFLYWFFVLYLRTYFDQLSKRNGRVSVH